MKFILKFRFDRSDKKWRAVYCRWTPHGNSVGPQIHFLCRGYNCQVLRHKEFWILIKIVHQSKQAGQVTTIRFPAKFWCHVTSCKSLTYSYLHITFKASKDPWSITMPLKLRLPYVPYLLETLLESSPALWPCGFVYKQTLRGAWTMGPLL